jgi:predicted nucleic acid-binding protein
VEGKFILLDTGILIEYFRKTDKSKSVLYKLAVDAYQFKVSSITKYEILLGATANQMNFWEEFFTKVQVLSFNGESAVIASELYKDLKSKNRLIDMADIVFASIAVSNSIPLATLNLKHFSRIEGLEILTS